MKPSKIAVTSRPQHSVPITTRFRSDGLIVNPAVTSKLIGKVKKQQVTSCAVQVIASLSYSKDATKQSPKTHYTDPILYQKHKQKILKKILKDPLIMNA